MPLSAIAFTNYKSGAKTITTIAPSQKNPEPSLSDEREIHSIVFETSPYGNVDAIVEHDARAVYFYLNESPASRERSGRFGMRACWVRNLQKGPHVINVDEMQAGIATMLPRHDCIDPELHRLPTAETLKIVWLEEGTGAALIEVSDDETSETIIAVIPPWSGVDGFHGYASNCANSTAVCWPMPDNPLLTKRIENAQQFWKSWKTTEDESKKTPWDEHLPSIINSHDQRFSATPSQRLILEVPGQHFPLLKILQYKTPQHDILITAGLSIFPQPAVEMFVENPSDSRRIEIALLLDRDGVTDDSENSTQAEPESLPPEIANQLAGLAMYPWQNFTWLGPGHSCNFASSIGDIGLLLGDSDGSTIAGLPPKNLPKYREDAVNLIWLKPISKADYEELSAGTLTVDDIVSRSRN